MGLPFQRPPAEEGGGGPVGPDNGDDDLSVVEGELVDVAKVDKVRRDLRDIWAGNVCQPVAICPHAQYV